MVSVSAVQFIAKRIKVASIFNFYSLLREIHTCFSSRIMGERAERESVRAQEATNNMIEELDRTHLRKIQGKSYRCSAKCCEDSNLSIKQIYRCVASCNRSLSEAQVYCEKELKDSQDRVTRCVLDCNDRIKDKVLPETREAEIQKLEIEFDGCVAKCVDAHIASLPTLLNRMKSVLQTKLES